MSEQGYNGWANYPTWVVSLWLMNDEGTYHASRELVANAAAGSFTLDGDPPLTTRRVSAADALKDWVVNDLVPDLGGSLAADLMGFALDQVDWFEIADSFLAE